MSDNFESFAEQQRLDVAPPRYDTELNDQWPEIPARPSTKWMTARSMHEFVASLNKHLTWHHWQLAQEYCHKNGANNAAAMLNEGCYTSQDFVDNLTKKKSDGDDDSIASDPSKGSPFNAGLVPTCVGPQYQLHHRDNWVFLRQSNTDQPEFFLADEEIRCSEGSTLAQVIPHILVGILSYLPAPELFFAAMPTCSAFNQLSAPLVDSFKLMHNNALAALQRGRSTFSTTSREAVARALTYFEEGLLGFSYGSNVDAMLVCMANVGGCLDYLHLAAGGFALQFAAMRLAMDEMRFARLAIILINCGVIASHLNIHNVSSNYFFAAIHALLMAPASDVKKLAHILKNSHCKLMIATELDDHFGMPLHARETWLRMLGSPSASNIDEPHSPDKSRPLTARNLLAEFVSIDVVEEVLSSRGFHVDGSDAAGIDPPPGLIEEFVSVVLNEDFFDARPFDYFPAPPPPPLASEKDE